jgi:hypothetical protein
MPGATNRYCNYGPRPRPLRAGPFFIAASGAKRGHEAGRPIEGRIGPDVKRNRDGRTKHSRNRFVASMKQSSRQRVRSS